MRHHRQGKKFGRIVGDRKAFVKGLLHNLITKEKITTTLVRAKEVQRLIAPLITLGKKQTLASYRLLLERLPKKSAEKVFKDLSPRFKDRAGGYTRVVKLDRRLRDGAFTARISFVDQQLKTDK